MKKHLFMLLTVFSVFLFTACSSNTPSAVAEKFTTALAKGKIEEAKKYSTEPTAKLLDMVSSMAGNKMIQTDFKFTVVSEEINGDLATVTYTKGGEENEEDTIDLVKIDGNWKVSMAPQK